jgi:hypothetical protein
MTGQAGHPDLAIGPTQWIGNKDSERLTVPGRSAIVRAHDETPAT